MATERLAFRFTKTDRVNLAVVANGLRANGDTFANMTDALRHALDLAAAAAMSARIATVAPVAALDATP